MFLIIKSLESKAHIVQTGNYATATTNKFITDSEKIQQAFISIVNLLYKIYKLLNEFNMYVTY